MLQCKHQQYIMHYVMHIWLTLWEHSKCCAIYWHLELENTPYIGLNCNKPLTSHPHYFMTLKKNQTICKEGIRPFIGNVTVSWKRRPQGFVPLFLFHSLFFVCFHQRDVNVALSTPELHGLYKAEVGQIWLRDIKFCSNFLCVQVETEREKNCHRQQHMIVSWPQMTAVTQVVCAHTFLSSLNLTSQAAEAESKNIFSH